MKYSQFLPYEFSLRNPSGPAVMGLQRQITGDFRLGRLKVDMKDEMGAQITAIQGRTWSEESPREEQDDEVSRAQSSSPLAGNQRRLRGGGVLIQRSQCGCHPLNPAHRRVGR